ncbi:MAG: hypothetical protein IJP48_07655, partial [Synergistaceae bacterium]|nr:hypothetical protein [Synergistaceae bacterium]
MTNLIMAAIIRQQAHLLSKIGIVGLGYVGLTLAIAAADSGFEVYGREINPAIKKALSHNKAHFHETGLDSLIEKHNGKNFFCINEFPENINFDAFIITVGTPLKSGSHSPNFDYIRQAVQSIKSVYDGSQLVILRSTVSVGTTRNIIIPFLQELSGKPEVFVSMCPERTVEGRAIEEKLPHSRDFSRELGSYKFYFLYFYLYFLFPFLIHMLQYLRGERM